MIDDQLARLEDAPISAQTRAMLKVLEKMTTSPEAMVPADYDEVRALGVPDEGIIDALNIAYLFNIINRMADALRFEVGPQVAFDSSAKTLLGRGYKL